jgi:hypothetical protein
MGFTLTPEERDALLAKNRANADRIFPYQGGQEVNTSPTQEYDRYVINFGQMSLEQAEHWPDLLSIVRERVKPERDRLKNNADGLHRKKHWWLFGRWTPALYEAIANLDRCLVCSRVSKHLIFAHQPTDRIFSDALYVFPVPSWTAFAVLQSRAHEAWTMLLTSSMGRDNQLRYAASDCFDTFPFPQPDPRSVIPSIEGIGERLYTDRAKYMVEMNQGLTQTYNQLKDPQYDDPSILALRKLHEDMDRAVLDAYQWADLVVPPFCPMGPDDKRALEQFQDMVIDRLFVLNAERAAEEHRLGAATLAKGQKASAPKNSAKSKRKPTTGSPAAQSELFVDRSPKEDS